MRVNALASDLESSPPEKVLTDLENIAFPERDRVQFLLNFGILKSLSGDFDGSIKDLQEAKSVIQQVEAISISENIGAVTVNDTLKSYAATPGEQMLLHQILLTNYLLKGQLDEARVEVLQAQVKAKKFSETSELTGRLASMEYLAGLVYELHNEVDNAMISYRNAARFMKKRDMEIPDVLQNSLLRCSYLLGLKNEYKKYVNLFGRKTARADHKKGEVTVIFWDGVVSAKKQNFITVYVPKLEHNVTLALPYYPDKSKPIMPLVFTTGDNIFKTEPIENVEKIVREDLDAQKKVIYSTALARMVAKHLAIKVSQGQNAEGLSILLNLASVLTEAADVRSWNMLPSSIQVARVKLAPGRYQLFPNQTKRQVSKVKNNYWNPLLFLSEVKGATNDQPVGKSMVRGEKLDEFMLDIKAGQKVLLFVPGVTNRVYSHYM
ncbi:hypothetical protein [Zooshikella sp. RANM57]|uniref:hypothetical protein n=1 Tax=Zooshikella sp. RANM57 TaxID=3425863 RepID=UPI003D6FC1DF